MNFNIEYRYNSDNIGENVKSFNLIRRPFKIQWYFEEYEYQIESKLLFKTIKSEKGGTKVVVANDIYDFISSAYLLDKGILILYSSDDKHNHIFPHPNNLVLYNLKKEVIKIITPPRPKHYQNKNELPIISVGGTKSIDNQLHIGVSIGIGDADEGYAEHRYLNLETFEYHPTYYETDLRNGFRAISEYKKCGR